MIAIKRAADVVLSGKFTITLTPVGDNQVHSTIASEGFQANALGLGIAVGSIIGWFLDGSEKAMAEAGTPLDSPEKRATWLLATMSEIHRGSSRALQTSEPIPSKENRQ